MARFARQDAVPAEEGKPRLFVLLDHVGDLPRLHRMTAQAVFSQLTLVHVSMARTAGGPGRWKLQPGMAVRAGNGLMLPHELESGRCVIKRNIFPYFPAVGRMAGLARERQRAVGRFLS